MTPTPLTPAAFAASLRDDAPPQELPPLLLALWHAGRDDWEAAHRIAQDQEGEAAAAVHAYLHRVEGDQSNARYWYRRAGRDEHAGTTAAEWDDLARELLQAR